MTNQNLCMPSWPGVFQLGIFLSVALSESKNLLPTGPSLGFLFLFSFYLSIHLFSYVLSDPIFYSILLHSVVGLFSCILQRFVQRIFFCYFGRSWFVCITWPCPSIFWNSLLSPIFFIYFFQLYCQNCLRFSFVLCSFFFHFCFVQVFHTSFNWWSS